MTRVVVHEPGPVVVTEEEDNLRLIVREEQVRVDLIETTVKVVPSNTGIQGPPGPPGNTISTPFQTVHTWAISGEINVAVGEEDFIPPMFVALTGTQTAAIAEVRHRLNSGGTTQVKLQKNGVDVPGYTNVNVSTTPGVTDAADQPVIDGDLLALVVVSTTGTPMNMTFTVVLEHTA